MAFKHMMLKDIWFMFYNQCREYLKASSPPPLFFWRGEQLQVTQERVTFI